MENIDSVKKDFIDLLEKENYNITKVAKILKVSRPTVYNYMNKLGININDKQPELLLRIRTALNKTK